jgi:hypothetical protein
MRRAAVFASAIIGEASYKTAANLGIDPDPSSGGTDSGVTYIFFKNATISPIENHSTAVRSWLARSSTTTDKPPCRSRRDPTRPATPPATPRSGARSDGW